MSGRSSGAFCRSIHHQERWRPQFKKIKVRHHPGPNQNTDKTRATHYLESDTDMLSVSGGFGGGTFRRPPYCRRFFGISINRSPPNTHRARAYSGEFDDRPFVRVTRHTNPLFTAGLDRTFKTRKSQKKSRAVILQTFFWDFD